MKRGTDHNLSSFVIGPPHNRGLSPFSFPFSSLSATAKALAYP
jgi:hypothetical protein